MRVRIEKRASWDRGSYEADLSDLHPDAQAAVKHILSNPPPSATPPGGDRPWYKLTVDDHQGEARSFDLSSSDLPEALAVLPKPAVP